MYTSTYIILIVLLALARLVFNVDIFLLQKIKIDFYFELQEAHVNTCYKHFFYFVSEFELVSPKELEPLAEMTAHVCKDQ